MHASPHTTNSDFQNRFFVEGGAKTPDGKFAVVYAQHAAAVAKLEAMRGQALHIECERLEHDAAAPDWIACLRAFIRRGRKGVRAIKLLHEAQRIQHYATTAAFGLNLQGAENEVAGLARQLADIEPKRKYSHLPLLEAIEAAQEEEWEEEIKFQAECYRLAEIYGIRNHDLVRIARQHPKWKETIEQHMLALMPPENKRKPMVSAVPEITGQNIVELKASNP